MQARERDTITVSNNIWDALDTELAVEINKDDNVFYH